MTKIKHVEKIGRRTVDEYHLIVNGSTVATSHCVNVPADRWTIVHGGRWTGLAVGWDNVSAALMALA